MTADTPEPRFLGDGDGTGGPVPPDGWGAVACVFWFTSAVDLVRADRVVNDRSNYDIWVPRPVLRVDGRDVPASWSGWWYPLRPGPHQVEVLEPAPAGLRVQVTAGATDRLRYRARIRIRKDHTDTHILEWRSTATLDPVAD
ncbi:MAG TPA: hypothetical protein VFX70_07170 [Mycobacteriales bacterium]|nr:hypothetical protein [Mycobacteriales bacterium]